MVTRAKVRDARGPALEPVLSAAEVASLAMSNRLRDNRDVVEAGISQLRSARADRAEARRLRRASAVNQGGGCDGGGNGDDGDE